MEEKKGKRVNMVKRRDYEKGTRREITQLALACGCLSYRRLTLLGMNVKTVRKKIHEMCKEGVFEIVHDGEIWVAGFKDYAEKSEEYKNPANERLHRYYNQFGIPDYKRVKYAKNWESIRVIRNVESYMFFYGAGLDCLLGSKVSLRAREDVSRRIRNSFYTAREVKGYDHYKDDLGNDRLLNTTRVNGLAVCDGGTYAVYHTGKSILTYTRSGEKKMETYINRMLVIKNQPKLKGAIILAHNMKVYTDMIVPKTRKIMDQLANMEGVYEHVYGLTLDEDGQRMMRLMETPNWDTRMYDEMLEEEKRRGRTGTLDCDGQEGDTYCFCYCVPDIKRFKMFLRRAELEKQQSKFRILCFDSQKELIKQVAGNYAKIATTSFSDYYHSHALEG